MIRLPPVSNRINTLFPCTTLFRSPVDVQGAFASPAIIALASLFVIAYGLELSGLLDRAISLGVDLCRRMGTRGIWLLLSMIGGVSCFLNSTPIVVLGAPVVRDVAQIGRAHV